MAKIFSLNSQNTDDKIVNSDKRIYSDRMSISSGSTMNISTKSVAPSMKIKFFLDAVRVVEGTSNFYYKIGQYYELEDGDVAQFITERGFFSFSYSITGNNGNYSANIFWNDTLKYSFQNTFLIDTFYISKIVFEDSYYQESINWLNRNSIGNISDLIVTQKLPGARRMDLTYFHNTFRGDKTVGTGNIVDKTYYIMYSDDFFEYGFFSVAGTGGGNYIVFLPKNNYRIQTGTEIDKGSLIFDLPAALANLTEFPVNLQSPPNTEPWWNQGIIGLPIGWAFVVAVSTATTHTCKMTWIANDSYTYSIEFYIELGNITGTQFTISTGCNYMGRCQTGQIPVTEGGI